MTLEVAFWILMFLWFIFGAAWCFGVCGPKPTAGTTVGTIFVYLLFFILGWAEFGAPIHG